MAILSIALYRRKHEFFLRFTEGPGLVGRLAPDIERQESASRAEAATAEIGELLDEKSLVGDLIRMDFDEAHILIHDALREQVGGVPDGCFLLAARSPSVGTTVPSLLLLRVLGSSALPNDIETQQAHVGPHR
ncbi:MAG: hypothetical protein F4060_10475 [Holophagales bacterium]|nr:hypothetical protein [Holophagales bacterium]MYG30913.1 hypothetical protein [Holophagales bacterium]MYI80348.1 hypothetical protein [Holophagales bacterium]